MDPNNTQTPVNPLTPLDNSSPTPVPPPAPVQPPPVAQVPPAPTAISPSPEGPKKGSSVMTVAAILMVTVLIIALGYIAYVKFVGTSSSPATTNSYEDATAPVDQSMTVDETQPTEIVPESTDTTVPSDNPDAVPTDEPVPTEAPLQ